MGTRGEHANSTQKGPFANPASGMCTDDAEEGTHRQHPQRPYSGNGTQDLLAVRRQHYPLTATPQVTQDNTLLMIEDLFLEFYS